MPVLLKMWFNKKQTGLSKTKKDFFQLQREPLFLTLTLIKLNFEFNRKD